jgi:hypothetical protein
MTNEALVINISETMATLMRSVGKYVYYRLPKSERQAYRHSMKTCIKHVSNGADSIEHIIKSIEEERHKADVLYKDRLFKRLSSQRNSHLLAIDHALDIVRSLEARFITGQFDPEPRAYKHVGELYEDEDLFR